MRVFELIKCLQTFPPDMQVAYKCFSEQLLLEKADIRIEELCEPRPDGWIQNKRFDMPTKTYLVFPGN